MKIPEQFNYLDINPQIEFAFESIFFKHNSILIIGNAGSGKSTFLSMCKTVCEENRISSAFLAPTGIAAVRIKGQTLHSFFKLPLSMLEPELVPLKEEVGDLIRNIDIFFIDEISMVRADIFETLDSLMRRATEIFHKPFGGKQIVLVGDLFQLPPIVGNSEKTFYKTRYGDNPYFFSSSIFSMFQDIFDKVEFSKIYRQEETDFTDILNRIRVGKQTKEDLEIINSKVEGFNSFKTKYKENIYISPFNKTVDGINKKYLKLLSTDEYLFPAFTKGLVNFKNHMIPKDLWLKPGAKIMTLTNNFDEGYQNGSIGTFVSVIDKDNLLLDIKGEDVLIERKEFSEYEYKIIEGKLKKEQKGSVTQFPVKLSWALTVHKSQGNTFNSGYIDLGGSSLFADHMAYVILSRFKDLNKIGLKRALNNSDIKINSFVLDFMKTFDYTK